MLFIIGETGASQVWFKYSADHFKAVRAFLTVRATSNTTMVNKAARRARVPAVRGIVMFCAMIILFYAVFFFCSSTSCHRRLSVLL